MTTVISIENLSKTYRLGQIGSGTVAHDLNVWWAKMRGKPNPMLKIGEKDHDVNSEEEFWALKDISFKVEQGEVLGIIGRNGAGKSTLLKILSRVTAPTSGIVKVKGRIASLLEVGTGFHPELTGRENIYLNGAILGMNRKEIERKFDEIVDFAGVEKFIDTPVKRYSSGMYVRLAFAVAAHLEPEILIVDEVLAVGDAEFQKKCLGKMGDVAHEGRTVLFVSHNMGAIKSLCHVGLWIEKGEKRLIGDVDKVASLYMKQDILEINTNKFSNRVKGDGTIKLVHYMCSGERIVNIHTNEKLEINILIEASHRIQYPACGIGFYNENGDLLSSVNTVEMGKALPPLPSGQSIVKAIIKNFPFLPGKYIASFWIMNPQRHIYVNAEKEIIFTVSQTPVYGNSEIDIRWGSVYVPIEFTFTSQELGYENT